MDAMNNEAAVTETDQHARACAMAYGELEGRRALAGELEDAFGIDSRNDLTAEDVKRIRASQLH